VSENSLIRDIGRSFIVSSFIPSALFITVASLVFRDFFPYVLATRLIANDQLYAGQWFLFALFVFWTGFGLYSAWNWTVYLFEGYLIPSWLAEGMKERLHNQKTKRMERINEFCQMKERRSKCTAAEIASISRIEQENYANKQLQAMEDYQIVELSYPKDKQNFLPTRLGNLLRASEMYSWDRYRMEGVTCFSRLVHLFPTSFANQLEEQNNKFIFLLNSSLLSLMIGLLCFLVILLRQPCYWLHPKLMSGVLQFYSNFACTNGIPQNFFQKGFASLSETKYFFIGLGFLAAGYLIYRIALTAANATRV
jgi:hypothetical protein